MGYGMLVMLTHITAPAEDGDGGYRAMKVALEMGKIDTSKLVILMLMVPQQLKEMK